MLLHGVRHEIEVTLATDKGDTQLLVIKNMLKKNSNSHAEIKVTL